MEATVAERGQITLPKAVRDALGLTKGTQLKVELDGSRIILRKNVDDAVSRLRGRFKLAEGFKSTDEAMRAIRGRAPGDPYLAPAAGAAREVIALDASVLVDVLAEDPRYADASEASLGQALAAGEVVVCDAVVAEIHTLLADSETTMDSLAALGIRFLPTSEQAAVRAGHMQRRFYDRGGRRERVVADFLIGAHALLQCDALVTRDAAFFRDYFKGLKVIEPRVR